MTSLFKPADSSAGSISSTNSNADELDSLLPSRGKTLAELGSNIEDRRAQDDTLRQRDVRSRRLLAVDDQARGAYRREQGRAIGGTSGWLSELEATTGKSP